MVIRTLIWTKIENVILYFDSGGYGSSGFTFVSEFGHVGSVLTFVDFDLDLYFAYVIEFYGFV